MSQTPESPYQDPYKDHLNFGLKDQATPIGETQEELVLPWEPKALRRRNHILLLESISVVFDGFLALNNLNLAIKEGELRCVIGPNGAGKTTMMDVITGYCRPNKGEAWYRETLNLLEADEVSINQAGIGRKFQKPSVF
ncbi:MAG: ATP-binding cassette domain-containing protein, partial [Deltaproteobacteria bacterium]|nr:ATP-binding cassette domain-containing protein [Deltaproteobacteria bacterium]